MRRVTVVSVSGLYCLGEECGDAGEARKIRMQDARS